MTEIGWHWQGGPRFALAGALAILLQLGPAAAAEWKGGVGGVDAAGKIAAGGGGGTCTPGGSSAASNCPGWGGYIKPMPGTICTMNVGNATPFSFYTNKIRNCQEATDRRSGIAGDACDVINIIELNSKQQCECACNPVNQCLLWDTSPFNICLLDSPARPLACKTPNQGYYDPDRCALCKGCGAGAAPSCEAQAQVICDPGQYWPPKCSEEPDKGCDCMCIRKGPCSLQAGSCQDARFNAPADCDSGNYATCRKCDIDGDGRPDWGTCTAHPPHCNPSLLRQNCLEHCSTPILQQAAQFLSDAKVRTISGDMNCDPHAGGCVAFGECPWLSLLEGYGLKVCGDLPGTTTGGLCTVDLVLSNFCGCGTETTRVPSPGDHSTIVFSSTPGYWTGPLTEILAAQSGSTCPDPDPPNDNTSDRLGAFASCPTTENGHPVAGCSSWGVTSNAKIRYYTRVDDCYLQPEIGMPKVLVCDSATASASATCTANASSGATAYVTAGKAQINTAMACNNGSVSGSPWRNDEKGEVVTPDLVTRADGNLYFRVERDAHRDRQATCNASLPSGPCPAPGPTPTTSAFSLKVATAPVCAEVVIPVQ